MTIERAYVASCDGCEDIFEDDDCMQAWIFESELRAAMKRRGWTESDGETLCKHCAEECAKAEGADSTEAR